MVIQGFQLLVTKVRNLLSSSLIFTTKKSMVLKYKENRTPFEIYRNFEETGEKITNNYKETSHFPSKQQR